MSRVLLRAARIGAKPLARVAALRSSALATAAVRATRAAVAAAVKPVVASAPSAPARAMATATDSAADPNRAKALIAANTVAKPAVVIAQSVFKSAILDVPLGVAWNGIRAFAGTWIPDSVIALAPDHKEDGSHNVIGHSRIVTVVPLNKRLVEQLVGYNDLKKSYTYRTLAVEAGIFPAPFWNYVGTVRLYEITEGNKTLATWTANYETAPGPTADQLYAAVGDGTLAANLVAFNQYLTSKNKK